MPIIRKLLCLTLFLVLHHVIVVFSGLTIWEAILRCLRVIDLKIVLLYIVWVKRVIVVQVGRISFRVTMSIIFLMELIGSMLLQQSRMKIGLQSKPNSKMEI